MRIAYVLGTFPSISETFILREILALKERGIEIDIFSLRGPGGGKTHGSAEPLVDQVCYRPVVFSWASISSQLYFLLRHPWRYLSCAAAVKSMYLAHPTLLLKAMRNFLAAAFFAREAMARSVDHIHAHFAFIPSDVAMVMAGLLRKKFSISAHAWDIYTQKRSMLAGKILRSSFVVACTRHGQAYLRALFPELSEERIAMMYHGVEIREPASAARAATLILAVGRLEEKKGFRHLVEACTLLMERGIDACCSIVGEGPKSAELRELVEHRGLVNQVTLTGELTQDELIELYGRATVFVLPSIVTESGDRDGLANVIMEAMAMGIPVISTSASAANEAIDSGENGFIVDPADPGALADRIEELAGNGQLRADMGQKARQLAVERFDVSTNINGLLTLLRSGI